ncbi:MAG: hypothetical protein AAF663_08375, partial [Planctomycetota bacterium]
ARRMQCGTNIRSMVQGSLIIAEDESNRVPFPNADSADGENIAHLFPLWVRPGKLIDGVLGSTFDAAICPSTENTINVDPNVSHTRSDGSSTPLVGWSQFPGRGIEYNPFRDLYTNASEGGDDDTGGHSYELYPWADFGIYRSQDVTQNGQVDADYYRSYSGGVALSSLPEVRIKTDLWVKDLASAVLIGDNDAAGDFGISDDDDSNGFRDNHAGLGANYGFMDGHVAFESEPRQQVEALLDGLIDMTRTTARANALDSVGITSGTRTINLRGGSLSIPTYDY